jgi:potassium inwardly-rectifying channel subfamily J
VLPGGSLCNVNVDEIKRYWRETRMEIVVIVEGIDAVSSASFQVCVCVCVF